MPRATVLILAVVLLSATLVLPPRPAAADPLSHDARIEALVEDLETHAKRCHSAKLFRDRDQTYELLLHFRPDHKTARKWLKYKRRDGAWAHLRPYKRPRNFKQPSESVLADRRALGDRFTDDTLAWMAAQGERLDFDARARLLEEAALVAPHRKDVHEASGEQLSPDGDWLLAASVRALTRRPEVAQIAQQALDAVALPQSQKANDAEAATHVSWQAIVAGPLVRIAGTVPMDEVIEEHRVAAAAYTLFPTLCGVNPKPDSGLTVLMVTNDNERNTLLRNHPLATPAFVARASKLSSAWIPSSSTVFARSSKRPKRIEWSSRQTMGLLLKRRFGITTKHGWAWEGFGLYASHLLSGVRSTFFVRRTRYGDRGDRSKDLWSKLVTQGADWRAEGRAMLAGPDAPDLRLLFGKPVNTMNTEDLLASYLVAAYIIEGHPDRAESILTAVAGGKASDVVLREGLQTDATALTRRLRRWLEETKEP